MIDGSIVCRPGIASIDGRTVTFTDGSTDTVEAIACATGYDVDLPYLSADVRRLLGPDLALYQRTFHPDLDGLGFIGQFLARGRAVALTLSEELGVAPEPIEWDELCEPLLFGPMLPPRYRLSGPGATPDARHRCAQQLAASPRAPVDPADMDALQRFGWQATAAKITAGVLS